ncbi:MAG: histidine kinase [Lewinellaceae bacterium]|nr:histidine kinase [Saprospiraceae bacterium]MCB9337212.1 histidine kinase [Lewinellaceae bacterium]
MNTTLKKALIVLWLALSVGKAEAQRTIWFNGLGKEDGLSANTIINVYVDAGGFTWIAAMEGLFRFDGRTLKQYRSDPANPFALKENYITGNFFEDREHDIWFCTLTSIHCYRRKSDNFQRDTIYNNGLPILDGYRAVCLEQDSFLWVQAGDKDIYRYNIYEGSHSKPLGRPDFDISLCPGFSPDGKLKYIFSTDGGKSPGLEVFEHDGLGNLSKSPIYFSGNETDSLYIPNVIFEHDTAIWLAARSGVYKWDKKNARLTRFATANPGLNQLATYNPEQFLVSEIGQGLSLFDKKAGSFSKLEVRSLKGPNDDPGPYLEEPFYDRFGNLWLINGEDGLSFANLQKTKVRAKPKMPLFDGTKSYEFRAIVQCKDKNIWCSTFGEGVFMLDEQANVLRHYHPNNPEYNSLFGRQANHIMLDKSQGLWVGTVQGVARYSPENEKFEPVYDLNGNHVPYVVYFHQLHNGKILAATLQQGIYLAVYEGGQWRLKQIYPPSGDADYFQSIYEDSLNTIYIGHKFVEVCLFNFTSSGILEKKGIMPIPGLINGFYEGTDNNMLWIATSNGLVEMDKTNLQKPPVYYTEKDGLISKNIQSILADGSGNLWMGTTNGLVRFNVSDTSFNHFTLADGIQSTVFDVMAAMRHVDGSLWFLGNNGITIVNPDSIRPLLNSPIIQLTGIEINSTTPGDLMDKKTGATNVSEITDFERPYGDNDLLFEFVGIDYSDPAAVQLGYKMDGVNNDTVWLEKGEKGVARFPNLPHGEYTFWFFANNSDGNGIAAKSIHFTIAPHWTQTWWFMAIVALAILSLLYAYYRFRINQIKKQEEMRRKEAEFKQKEAEFRQKEAEYKLLVAETETAVLRLQMNPHFIFNSMNSINSYILKKDIETASDYLGRFAGLMRKILKYAANKYISVSEEIELLEMYCKTEAMRFEGDFEYIFKVDEALDPDETILPTMILQPFVENAIWHGLSNNNGRGRVTVRFDKRDGSLICSVEDNGQGREAARHQKSQTVKHESKALSITERRLKLLEQEEGSSSNFEIIDLKDGTGVSTGTRVVLRLPLL